MTSSPPPPRRPGLAKSGTLPRRIEIAKVLRRWCIRHHVSERDLAEVLGCSKQRASDYLDASLPFPIDAILALPERHALDLIAAVQSVALARRTA